VAAGWATRTREPYWPRLLVRTGWGGHALPGALRRKERLGIDEADGVIERIASIEASFAPWSDPDGRQFLALGVLCSCVYGVEVINAEIDRLRIRANAFGIAMCKCVVAGNNRATAIEVVAARGDTRSLSPQELGVEGGGPLDVGDRQHDPKQSRDLDAMSLTSATTAHRESRRLVACRPVRPGSDKR
jgi:hypothetical protein